MINKSMSDQKSNTEKKDQEKKPNEKLGFQISTHVKIHDPNTKEVLMQKRGDV